MNKTPESRPNDNNDEPKSLGEILEDVDSVIDAQPDEDRVADVEETRLTAEVGELTDAREGMIEANQAGQGDHDVTDINQARLEAEAELNEAVVRHPSNPDQPR